ncbi:MAG: hypothetical protein HFH09_04990 [Bacilli bacterium]|nr:hypothetical protein [Bacilli bacterium]
MNYKLVKGILELMVNQNFKDIDIIKEQIKKSTFLNSEIYGDNKYIVFQIDKEDEKVKTTETFLISIMFLDKTYDLPIDCILFFDESGYIKSLEIYSCNGESFEDIDLNNIEIKKVMQEF